jgi:NAD-dependent DNA ligase
MANAGVCHTGTFMYGTRAAVERLTLKAGGMPLDNVTKKTDVLVAGAMVSSDWAHASFGSKIQRAAELQQSGHPIHIISEQRWMQLVSGV